MNQWMFRDQVIRSHEPFNSRQLVSVRIVDFYKLLPREQIWDWCRKDFKSQHLHSVDTEGKDWSLGEVVIKKGDLCKVTS